MRTLFLCLAAAPALAFTPAAPLNAATQNGVSVAPRAPRQVRLARGMSCPTCMSAEGQFSAAARTFAGVLAVGSTFLPGLALASAGDSPKQSFFGADAASSPYAYNEQTPLYSPYSPYGDGKNSLYKNLNPDEVARAKAKFTEAEKRVTRIPGYLQDKKWTEISGELSRQMYDTRGSMNKLASGKPAAQKAASAFYQDIEEINTAALRKDGATVKASYEKATNDLKAFKSAL